MEGCRAKVLGKWVASAAMEGQKDKEEIEGQKLLVFSACFSPAWP